MRHGHNHQSQGHYKHDAPNFKWGGKGKPGAYTRSADAKAYVAKCRRREIEKMHRAPEIMAIVDEPIVYPISVSDWNAALPGEPFTCSGEAWRSNGLGAVIDWGRPAQKVAVQPAPVSIVARAGDAAGALGEAA